MTDLHIECNEIAQKDWDQLLDQAEYSAMQQAWAFGEALTEGHSGSVFRHVAFMDGKAVALAQVVHKKFWGLYHISQLMRGPVWLKDVSLEAKQQFISHLKAQYAKNWRSVLMITPEDDDLLLSEELQKSNFRQIYTSFTTAILSLAPSQEDIWSGLYGKWRNQCRRAEKNELQISIGNHTHLDVPWLLNQENQQQQDKRYRGLPAELVNQFAEHCGRPDDVLSVFAFHKGADQTCENPIAGALFLRHGQGATYHIGWNGKEGRKLNAQNLVLWRGIVELKKQGVSFLDLGGINTADGADLARFKLGISHNLRRLIGTFM